MDVVIITDVDHCDNWAGSRSKPIQISKGRSCKVWESPTAWCVSACCPIEWNNERWERAGMRKGWGEEWEYWNKIIFLEANIQRKVLILEWGRSENKMTSGQWSGMAVELNQSRGRTLPSISWWESHLVLLHMTSFFALQVVPALLLLLLLAQPSVSQEGAKVKFGARWVSLPCVCPLALWHRGSSQ